LSIGKAGGVTQLTIGHLAERAGVATSAIRFYESRGLIHSVRTSGNQRRYEQHTLRRIGFIRTAQRIGLSLEEIAEALATLPDNRTPTKSDWHRLSRSWRPRLDEQIRRIELLRDRLDGCIGCGCLSMKSCALMNPGDEAASYGTGAVWLEPRQ
jgi:MerR family transcriptional regulator, redox-sensitive transcriptional activator SoxR